MDGTVLGGLVSCETTTPLQAPDGQDPESGEILISGGDGNGTIRIAIDSSTLVRLEIDPDGDGIVDDSPFHHPDGAASPGGCSCGQLPR